MQSKWCTYFELAHCACLPYKLHPPPHPPHTHTHTHTLIYIFVIPVLVPNIGEILLKAEKKKKGKNQKKINLIMNKAFRCRVNKSSMSHISHQLQSKRCIFRVTFLILNRITEQSYILISPRSQHYSLLIIICLWQRVVVRNYWSK